MAYKNTSHVSLSRTIEAFSGSAVTPGERKMKDTQQTFVCCSGHTSESGVRRAYRVCVCVGGGMYVCVYVENRFGWCTSCLSWDIDRREW